jgi:hypothetical protein
VLALDFEVVNWLGRAAGRARGHVRGACERDQFLTHRELAGLDELLSGRAPNRVIVRDADRLLLTGDLQIENLLRRLVGERVPNN